MPTRPRTSAHPLPPLAAGDPLDAEAVADVLGDGPVGPEGVVLEDDPDPPLGRGQGVDEPALEVDLPLVGPLDPRDDPRQGRLARAGRSDEERELAGADLQRCAVDDGDLVVALDDRLDRDADHDAAFPASRAIRR